MSVLEEFTGSATSTDLVIFPALNERVFYGQSRLFAEMLEMFVGTFLDFDLADNTAFQLFLQGERLLTPYFATTL